MSHIQSHSPDIEVLKDIPGYQAILKAVLKSQIQYLVEQLFEQTGEESVLLTASVADGTLSHLGSSCGKFFLQDHKEFKSKFLRFCLNCQLKRKSEEFTKPYEDLSLLIKRQRVDESVKSSTLAQTFHLGISHNVSKTKSATSTSESVIEQTYDTTFPTTQADEKVVSSENIKQESTSEKLIEEGNEKGPSESEFLVNINKDSTVTNPDEESEVGLIPDIKQEPDEVPDKSVISSETFPVSDRPPSLPSSIKEACGLSKLSSRLQTHGRMSKIAATSMATDTYADLGNPTGLNPMLSDFYLREVLSQITTKTAQLTELNIETGLPTVPVPVGDKPYRCHLCGRGFAQRGNLEVHMWTQHGNK